VTRSFRCTTSTAGRSQEPDGHPTRSGCSFVAGSGRGSTRVSSWTIIGHSANGMIMNVFGVVRCGERVGAGSGEVERAPADGVGAMTALCSAAALHGTGVRANAVAGTPTRTPPKTTVAARKWRTRIRGPSFMIQEVVPAVHARDQLCEHATELELPGLRPASIASRADLSKG
jgi:hypothetical protein